MGGGVGSILGWVGIRGSIGGIVGLRFNELMIYEGWMALRGLGAWSYGLDGRGTAPGDDNVGFSSKAIRDES